MRKKKSVPLYIWLPVACVLIAVIGSLQIRSSLQIQEGKQIEKTLQAQTTALKNGVKKAIQQRIETLLQETKVWEVTGRPNKEDWSTRAAILLARQRGFHNIQWIDPKNTVQWIVPMLENKALLGKPLSDNEKVAHLLKQAKKERKTLVSEVTPLNQNQMGFTAVVPIFLLNGRFDGYLLSTFNIENLLEAVTGKLDFPFFKIGFYSGAQKIFEKTGELFSKRNQLQFSEKLNLYGTNWMLQAIPDSQSEKSLRSSTPNLVGLIGSIFGVFLALIVYFSLRAAENARRAKEAESISAHTGHLASIGEMAGGIAHEINTPLGAILLCAQTVQQELDATEIDKNSIKKLALKIETIVGRIAKIIQALRAYSRGNNTDPFLDTPIHQIIENSVSLVREKLRLRGIEIRGLDSVEKGLFIQCREAQIGQVIMNLLGNSADAIEKLDKKWVEIEVEDLGENIRIKITDSGKGIPKHLHDKIFDPFFTSKDIGKGTGLGLSISAGAIQEHHGAIFVDANSKNTCFVIHLPKMQISNEEDPFSEAA